MKGGRRKKGRDLTQLYLAFVVVFGSCMGSTDPPLTCRGKVERGASRVTLVPVCMTSEPYWEVCVCKGRGEGRRCVGGIWSNKYVY